MLKRPTPFLGVLALVTAGSLASNLSASAEPADGFDAAGWLDAAATKTVEVVVHEAKEPMVITGNEAMAVAGLLALEPAPNADPKTIGTASAPALFAQKIVERFAGLTTASLYRREGLLPMPLPKDVAVYRGMSPADYVLEVAVPAQLITYQGLKLSRFTYYAKPSVRLIDNATGRVMWSHDKGVKSNPKDPSVHLSYDEFAANDGKRFKDIVDLVLTRNADETLRVFTGSH